LKRAIAIALALATSGCMVGPDYHRPGTSLPGAFAEPDAGKAGIDVPH